MGMGHTGFEKVGGAVVAIYMAPAVEVGFQCFDVLKHLPGSAGKISGFVRAFSLWGFVSLVAKHIADKAEILQKLIVGDRVIHFPVSRITILPEHICPAAVNLAHNTLLVSPAPPFPLTSPA